MANRKLLIIASWAPPMVGGPQNVYNLFSQFPKDSYTIITSKAAIDAAQSSGVSGNWLPCHYHYFDAPETTARAEQLGGAAATAQQPRGVRSIIIAILRRIPLFGRVVLGTANVFSTIRQMTAMIEGVVREEKPSLLLGISDTGPSMIATALASRRTAVPYTYYLFDLYRGNLLPQPYRLTANLIEGRLLRNAAVVIVTNEATERYLQQRYGEHIRTAVVHNSAFADTYPQWRTSYHPNPPYEIVFTGNIYWAQEQAVLSLIAAMRLLHDLPVRLTLYCPKPTERVRAAIDGTPNITLTAAAQSEMPTIQSAATLLFLPLAWNTQAPDIIATATPGKFTDYLAAGRPMLVHAPDYAYVSQYTKQHDLGLVVDRNDVDLLARTIREFLAHPQERGQRYVQNALTVFHRNHDAVKNAAKLRGLLGI